MPGTSTLGGSPPGPCAPWPKATPSFAPGPTGHVIDVVTREPTSQTSPPDMARLASPTTHRSDVPRLVTQSAPRRGHGRCVAHDRQAPSKAGPCRYLQGPEPPTASKPHTSPRVRAFVGFES